MPRMTASKKLELESFWRAHLDGWRHSDLNQREYCELHGLPLKRFGNWRATLKHEEPASAGKLLYRRGGGLKHMSKHMLKEISSAPSSYIPSARSGGSGRRRNFSEADKRRIVEEASSEGASVSGVARKYGICSPFAAARPTSSRSCSGTAPVHACSRSGWRRVASPGPAPTSLATRWRRCAA